MREAKEQSFSSIGVTRQENIFHKYCRNVRLIELSKAHTVPKDRPYSSTERSQPSMNWITVERELFVLDSIKVSGWGGVGWDGGGGEPDKYVTNP